MKKYKNFFDFFGLDKDANKNQIKVKTTKKLKSLHPDSSENDDIEKFEDAKTGRDILIDDEKRKKYKKLGHNNYINKHVDNDLNGITFTGGSSLSESSSKGGLSDNTGSSDNLEDLIEFRDNNRTDDPTITAINQTNEDEKSSNDSAVEARKNWKEEDDDKQKAKKGMARLAVTILSIATSTKTKTIFLLNMLFSLYIIVYLVLGPLATLFAILLSIGLFYAFATIF